MTENTLEETNKETAPEPTNKESKKWPDSANAWPVGKKITIEDLQGKRVKSCLVVNHSPNYLAVIKVSASLLPELKIGALVKVGENVFYVAQRAPKKKLIGLFFVCNYNEAKRRSEEAKAPVEKEETLKAQALENIENVIS